jgi:hypothetical protein
MYAFAKAIGYEYQRGTARLFSHISAVLFFAFISAPILSPGIDKGALYLYWLIPLIDLSFLRRFFGRLSKRLTLVVAVMLSGAAISMHFTFLAKFGVLLLVLAYLGYLRKLNLFHYFYLWIILVILFGTIQYTLVMVDPAVGTLLGPESIGPLIWGDLARGNTNFHATNFTGGLLPRVSGLSLESGFFNALVSVSILLYLSDNQTRFKSKWLLAILAIGFLISLSKIGIGFIGAALLLLPFRRVLNFVSGAFVVLTFTLLLTVILTILYTRDVAFIVDSATIVHRTNGYYLLAYIPITEYMLPMDRSQLLDIQAEILRPGPFSHIMDLRDSVTGIPYAIFEFGLIGFLGLIVGMMWLRTQGFNVLMYLIVTFSVTPLTSDSFVVLATFYITDGAYRRHASRRRRKEASWGRDVAHIHASDAIDFLRMSPQSADPRTAGPRSSRGPSRGGSRSLSRRCE